MIAHEEFVRAVQDASIPLRSTGEKHWFLTQEAFDQLLAVLDPDREMAGKKYELIRCKLVKFFECRGCVTPEDEADETINVVTKRLVEGQHIIGDEPSRYFYGVARNVLREYWRRMGRSQDAFDQLLLAGPPPENLVEILDKRLANRSLEQQLYALEQCLLALPREARDLIRQYYDNRGETNRKARERLAKSLGIQISALRLRAHRIRMSLREHLSEYLEAHSADEIDISA
jgi:DNA-directed RNA polymerase specialized sigma24 family protein